MDSLADDDVVPTRRRRARLAILGAFVGLALPGFWLSRGGSAPDADEPSVETSSEAADAGPGGELAAPGRELRAVTASGAAGAAGAGPTGSPARRPPLPRLGTTWIVGEVVDERGRPVPGVHVGLVAVTTMRRHGRERPSLVPYGSTTTEAEGRFVADLQTAPVAVWAILTDDPRLTSAPVLAIAGGEPVRLVAVPRRTTRVLVVDSKNQPVSGATVTVSPDVPLDVGEWSLETLKVETGPVAAATGDRTELRAVTNATGLAVCPLPDARVRMALAVAPGNDRDDLLATRIAPWVATDEVTVRLAVGFPVSGRVVDAKGRPWTEGVVRWTLEGGHAADARIAYDGTFELPSQPPGPIRLEVVDPNLLRPKEPRSTVVAAGATDVVLRLDTANELALRVANRPKGAGGKVYLSVEGKDAAGRGWTIGSLENDGTTVLHGLLDDETYTLWIPAVELEATASADGVEPPLERTGYVYRRGITVRDSPLVVEEVAGEPVELTIACDGRWAPRSASIVEPGVHGWFGFEFLRARKAPDGAWTYAFRAWLASLPPGEWTVRVEGTDPRGDEPKRVFLDRTVTAGAKIHVDFAPPDERRK